MTAKVKLGDEVEDVVTGFKGIAVAITNWIHGCNRITIQPPIKKDGDLPDPCAFDEPAVKCVKKERVKPDTRKKKTGGIKNDKSALTKNNI